MVNPNRQAGGSRGKVGGHRYEHQVCANPTVIHSDIQYAYVVTGKVEAVPGNSRALTESKPDIEIVWANGTTNKVSVKKKSNGFQVQLSSVFNYSNLFSAPPAVTTVLNMFCGVDCVKNWQKFEMLYGPAPVPVSTEEVRLGRLEMGTIAIAYPQLYKEFVDWVNTNSSVIITTLITRGMAASAVADMIFFEEFGLFTADTFCALLDGQYAYNNTGSTFRIGLMTFQRYGNGKQAHNLQARLSIGDIKKALSIA